jgi:hypothetical protein
MPDLTKSTSLQGIWLVAIASLIALVLTLVAYFTPHGAIAHQWGTLLVLVSSALMLAASAAIMRMRMPHGVHVTLDVLILLDILGTAACAYFLEFTVLLILMIVALLGWAMHRMTGSRPPMAVQS